MISLRTSITVQPTDCLPAHSEPIDELPDGPEVTEEAIASALHRNQLTADQALWMHMQGIDWQINGE